MSGEREQVGPRNFTQECWQSGGAHSSQQESIEASDEPEYCIATGRAAAGLSNQEHGRRSETVELSKATNSRQC
jgi:hypothetical protein